MKRPLALFATLSTGVLFGALLPLALAHTPEECDCVCVECPEAPTEGVIEDVDGDGIPDTLEVEAEDAEAIRKALEAILRAEEPQQKQEEVPEELPEEVPEEVPGD